MTSFLFTDWQAAKQTAKQAGKKEAKQAAAT
jgi:hypothetical protein